MIKYLIGALLVIGLAFGIYMEVTGCGETSIQDKLKDALSKVTTLQKEKTDLDKNWATREKQLIANRDQLLVKVGKLQKEKEGLNDVITALRKERQTVVIPNAPDRICPEFVAAGFRSCSRTTAPK